MLHTLDLRWQESYNFNLRNLWFCNRIRLDL